VSDSGSIPPPPPPDPSQGQPGWGAAPPPPPPPGAWAAAPPPVSAGYGGRPLAEWPKRAVANLIDYFGVVILAILVQWFISWSLGALLSLVAIGWGLYNAYLQGESGQSTGKKMQNLRLLSESTGQPIGGGMGIARFFLHIVDAIPCYVGFLWPLWDAKKQTFADKIMKTVVVKG
jgi:uncharacterized RDD family membrane protein YckC